MVDVTICILFVASNAVNFMEVNGVTTQAAAIQHSVITGPGEQVTLSCMTENRAPLKYCQFEPPAGKPFSINSDVTPEKAILERYYFPVNKSLSRGDCAVFIQKVDDQDVGRWTCGAGLDDGKEYQGTIILQFKDQYEEWTFAFAAIGGVALLAIIIVGFVLKRRYSSRTESAIDGQSQQTSLRTESVNEVHSQQAPLVIPIITVQPPTPSPSPSSRVHNNADCI